jgi:hypothetical protein
MHLLLQALNRPCCAPAVDPFAVSAQTAPQVPPLGPLQQKAVLLFRLLPACQRLQQAAPSQTGLARRVPVSQGVGVWAWAWAWRSLLLWMWLQAPPPAGLKTQVVGRPESVHAPTSRSPAPPAAAWQRRRPRARADCRWFAIGAATRVVVRLVPLEPARPCAPPPGSPGPPQARDAHRRLAQLPVPS